MTDDGTTGAPDSALDAADFLIATRVRAAADARARRAVTAPPPTEDEELRAVEFLLATRLRREALERARRGRRTPPS